MQIQIVVSTESSQPSRKTHYRPNIDCANMEKPLELKYEFHTLAGDNA